MLKATFSYSLKLLASQNQNKDIDREQYTRPIESGSLMGINWNTREIVHLFAYVEIFFENSDKNKHVLLESLGWTLEEWYRLRQFLF